MGGVAASSAEGGAPPTAEAVAALLGDGVLAVATISAEGGVPRARPREEGGAPSAPPCYCYC